MGGKTSTSQSSVSIPPAILAEYQAATANAQSVSQTPFSLYNQSGAAVAPDYANGNTGTFVAPINSTQQAGIAGTTAAANEAQPYYGAATGVLGNAQANVNPINSAAESGTAASSAPLTGQQIDSYLSPFLGTVLNSTEAIQNQENQQAAAGQIGNAITSGAFGSDRTGIAAANLQQQEDLANANVISGIANTGYQSALSTAQGQQQIGLAGAQQLANIGSTAYGEGANTSSSLAALGSGAQSAGLAGASAELNAGTAEQQTQQAEDTAEYNQFLQEQSYPFQTSQFFTNAVEGTGALSGSTTTTTQPGGFFSDRRLKHSIRKIGKTYDHQDVYSYKMGDDPRTHIGLIAQDVEKKHPEAVGVAGGFKTVDYEKATKDAANDGHFAAGGVVPMRRLHRDTGGGLAGVLQAQQQMYANMPGGSQYQRVSNTGGSGGSHNLAVANPPPTAPPQSGMSQLSQGINTANNADKLYNNLTKPATTTTPTTAQPAGLASGAAPPSSTPVGGVVPATQGATPTGLTGPGLQSSGATTFAAPDATAVAAPAADTASTGAGAAAEGAADAGATDAAASGATAAAGAAGADAAADAAAALAAEYAAADVATVAVMAAKRGGRAGYDAGGVPYETSGTDSSGDLNIPDNPNTSTLKAAPAAGKQPTGFQTMLYMGNPNNTDSLMGSMFSNQALATGGVAERRGYDDGGDVDGGDLPQQTVTADAPSGLASGSSMTDTAPVGLASDTAAPKKSLWDKIKDSPLAKAENLVPLLSAIGAMGTAKTVHPGVALAAGLGAGAQSYVPTQEGLARAAQTEALTQGELNQNAVSAARARIANTIQPDGSMAPAPRNTASAPATQPPPLTPQPQTASPSDSARDTAAQAFQEYVDKYRTYTARTQEETAARDRAIVKDAMLGTGTHFQDIADTDFTSRVDRDTLQNHTAAQKEAAGLYQQATDPTVDQQTRQAAATRYNAVMQFTGDKYTSIDGSIRNDRTAAPAVGVAAQTLTPAQKADRYSQAWAAVTINNDLPKPAYLAYGFRTPEDYLDATAAAAVGAQPSAAPQTNVSGAPVSAPVGGAPPARSGTPPSALPQRQAPQTGVTSTGDQYLDKALSDPIYRIKPLPPVVDQTSRQKALDQQAINLKKTSDLATAKDEATDAAAQSLQYLNAANAIMDTKGAAVGLYGGVLTTASRVLGGGPQSTNYQELAKYLANAAIQTGEVGLQMELLSPAKDMDAAAIRNLLKTNIRSAEYTIDSAKRAKDYLDHDRSPQDFKTWNNQYFPRQKYINAPVAINPQTKQRVYFYNGQWQP